MNNNFNHYQNSRANNYQYTDFARIDKNREIMTELLSSKPYGFMNVLINASMSFVNKYSYKLHLKYFPKHTQIYILKNQKNGYFKQFFNLMHYKEQAFVKSGNDVYILCSPEEYFMVLMLHAFTEYGYQLDVRIFKK